MRSRVCKVRGKQFRYNYDRALVEWVCKPTDPDDEVEDGYVILDSVGLSRKNWDNKESRAYYLDLWVDDIGEECYCLAQDFKRFG